MKQKILGIILLVIMAVSVFALSSCEIPEGLFPGGEVTDNHFKDVDMPLVYEIYLDYMGPNNLPPTVKVRYQYYNLFVNKNVKNKWLWLIQYFTVFLQKLIFIKRKGIGPFQAIYKGDLNGGYPH